MPSKFSNFIESWVWFLDLVFHIPNFLFLFFQKKIQRESNSIYQHTTQYWKFCKHQLHCITNEIDDSKPEVHLLATFLKKWNLFHEFISILQYWKFVKCFQKIAKVVEFTLEQKHFQIFPKFLTKKWKILFGKNRWNFAWLKKKNNTSTQKEVNLKKRVWKQVNFLVQILARDQFLVITRIQFFNFQIMQHRMLKLEIDSRTRRKNGLAIENKGFQFPLVLGKYHLFVISTK